MTVESIRGAVKGLLVCGRREAEVRAVSTDTRGIGGGELFFALAGENHDGHDYIRKALEAGACGAVYSRDFPVYKKDAEKALIKVGDTLTALGDMAKAYRRIFRASVVGITGSNGKTTTKEMTRHLLEEKLETVASQASYNNFIGLPLTLFEVESTTRAAVVEMGTNHAREIARLTEIAQPDIGVITNVGRTHIEGLGSFEGVVRAKAELVCGLGGDAVAILNADDPSLVKMRSWAGVKAFTFGLSEEADVFAADVVREGDGYRFELNGAVETRLAVAGRHNIYNALAAVAVARRLGLELEYLAERLRTFKLPAMRLDERVVNGALVINDAYNANPESMASAIEELVVRKGKRKFFVFADMLELGEESQALHRETGAKAGKAGFDGYWATGSEALHAIEGILEAGVPEKRVRHFADAEELGRALGRELKAGDVVMLKASRGMKLEEVFDYLK